MHQKGNRMSSKDLRALFDIMLIKTDAGFLLFPRNVKSRKLAISLLLQKCHTLLLQSWHKVAIKEL